MSFTKKFSVLIFALLLLALVMIGSNLIYANENYPLDAEEKLIEERFISKDKAEIFTQLGDKYYLKRLDKNGNKWSVTSNEIVMPKWTGLNIDKINEQGDKELAESLKSKLNSFGVDAASLPQALDYSQSECLPPVGEQMENSCVGWSTSYYLRTYQQAMDLGWTVKTAGNGINSHIFSPSFIYNQINKGVDGGASIDAAAELLRNIGGATLERFPYIPGDYKTQPSQAVIQSAYPNRIREWRILYSNQDTSRDIIQKTKEYLNIGDLVVAGGKIGFKFFNPYIDGNGNSIITVEEYANNMHAYVVVGYEDNFLSFDGLGAFKIINSWGAGWGNSGFSYISYEAFTANALQGYVFTDLKNSTDNELNLEIYNSVAFNMDFYGTGRYDIKITNKNDETVFEENNLRGIQGLNTYIWDGRASTGAVVNDGAYKLSIIPYKDDIPKEPFELPFDKLGKVLSASSRSCLLDNVIQYVEIPITFKADGILNIKVIYNDNVCDIISNEAVKAGETKVYRIQSSEYDFNDKDLEKVRVKLDVR